MAAALPLSRPAPQEAPRPRRLGVGFPLAFAAILATVSLVPYVLAYVMTPPGHHFAGFFFMAAGPGDCRPGFRIRFFGAARRQPRCLWSEARGARSAPARDHRLVLDPGHTAFRLGNRIHRAEPGRAARDRRAPARPGRHRHWR